MIRNAGSELFIPGAMNTKNEEFNRLPVAAGRFYAGEKEALTADLRELFSACDPVYIKNTIRALIVPHAGYVYSGKTAATAYSTIPRDNDYKNIFIIGSSHVMSYEGASVFYPGDFITPLGRVSVNKDIAGQLRNEHKVFNFPVTPHQQEHSLEVQLPFIQYHFSKPQSIVPIIIGSNDKSTIKLIAEALEPWFISENLFIISSDFSHYPGYDDAVKADLNTAEGIISGDPEIFLSALNENAKQSYKGLRTSMCGWTSGLALLYLTSKSTDLEYKLIDYTNSGDSIYGSKDEVVGYNAIIVTQSL